MTDTPIQKVLSAIQSVTGKPAQSNGKGWTACCPAHDDQNPSLSITEGDDGRVLLKCFAGCTFESIMSACGLQPRDAMPDDGGLRPPRPHHRVRSEPTPIGETMVEVVEAYERQHGETSHVYVYRDGHGEECGAVLRWECDGSKTFRQLARNGDGWTHTAMPTPRPLYRLPDLSEADFVVVTEGEKCVEAAASLGFTATTSPGGANAPHFADWKTLHGKRVVILPDNDDTGRRYAEKVAQILLRQDSAADVRIVGLPGLAKGEDIVEFIKAHGANEARRQIEQLAAAAPRVALDSCQPIESGLARIAFPKPVPISELGEGDPVEWLWHGFIAAEHITLLVGLWKGGKTTLLAHLLRLFGTGGNLAGEVQPGKVLVVSEESRALWVRRRDDIGIGDNVEILSRPLLGKPNMTDWEAFVGYLAELVATHGYRVVAFDTVATFWPVVDENDASRVMMALTPLHRITQAGAGVLLVHHPRKGGGNEGQAARGSGALPGFVDAIVELRRYAPDDNEDRRRVLTCYGRFDEVQPEVVIELTDEGYRALGSKSEANQTERLAAIAELLPNVAPGLTAEDIREAWPEEGARKPSKRTVLRDLQHGRDRGLWMLTGSGVKNSPYRAWRPDSIRDNAPSIGCHESEDRSGEAA